MLDSEVWKNHNVARFWMWCLMKASHKDTTAIVGYQTIPLKAGQFITGRKKAAVETSLSERQIRDCISVLQTTNNLTIKTANKFSLVTIVNWDTYQSNEQDECPTKRPSTDPSIWPTNGQQTANKRPTNGHIQEDQEDQEVSLSSREEVFSDRVLSFAMEVIGLTPEGILTGWISINGWSEEWVIEALQIATEKGMRGNKAAMYAAGIMRGWSKYGKPEREVVGRNNGKRNGKGEPGTGKYAERDRKHAEDQERLRIEAEQHEGRRA